MSLGMSLDGKSQHEFLVVVIMVIICNQVSGGAIGEYGAGREYCPQCCPKRECVHDGSVCGPQDPFVPGGETRQLQVPGQGHCG